MKYTNVDKKERAKQRVKDLKGFYTHLMVYVMVNIMISVVVTTSLMYNGNGFLDAITNFGAFSTWFFWGIGVFFHALKVFSYSPFFSKNWEERQLQKYMEEDEQQSEKYK